MPSLKRIGRALLRIGRAVATGDDCCCGPMGGCSRCVNGPGRDGAFVPTTISVGISGVDLCTTCVQNYYQVVQGFQFCAPCSGPGNPGDCNWGFRNYGSVNGVFSLTNTPENPCYFTKRFTGAGRRDFKFSCDGEIASESDGFTVTAQRNNGQWIVTVVVDGVGGAGGIVFMGCSYGDPCCNVKGIKNSAPPITLIQKDSTCQSVTIATCTNISATASVSVTNGPTGADACECKFCCPFLIAKFQGIAVFPQGGFPSCLANVRLFTQQERCDWSGLGGVLSRVGDTWLLRYPYTDNATGISYASEFSAPASNADCPPQTGWVKDPPPSGSSDLGYSGVTLACVRKECPTSCGGCCSQYIITFPASTEPNLSGKTVTLNRTGGTCEWKNVPGTGDGQVPFDIRMRCGRFLGDVFDCPDVPYWSIFAQGAGGTQEFWNSPADTSGCPPTDPSVWQSCRGGGAQFFSNSPAVIVTANCPSHDCPGNCSTCCQVLTVVVDQGELAGVYSYQNSGGCVWTEIELGLGKIVCTGTTWTVTVDKDTGCKITATAENMEGCPPGPDEWTITSNTCLSTSPPTLKVMPCCTTAQTSNLNLDLSSIRTITSCLADIDTNTESVAVGHNVVGNTGGYTFPSSVTLVGSVPNGPWTYSNSDTTATGLAVWIWTASNNCTVVTAPNFNSSAYNVTVEQVTDPADVNAGRFRLTVVSGDGLFFYFDGYADCAEGPYDNEITAPVFHTSPTLGGDLVTGGNTIPQGTFI